MKTLLVAQRRALEVPISSRPRTGELSRGSSQPHYLVVAKARKESSSIARKIELECRGRREGRSGRQIVRGCSTRQMSAAEGAKILSVKNGIGVLRQSRRQGLTSVEARLERFDRSLEATVGPQKCGSERQVLSKTKIPVVEELTNQQVAKPRRLPVRFKPTQASISSFFDGQSVIKDQLSSASTVLNHETFHDTFSPENISHLSSQAGTYFFADDYSTIDDASCRRTRAECVNLLSSICQACSYRGETFHYAVNYFDRILLGKSIGDGNLGSIAVACLYVAAKMEEVVPPRLRSLTKIVSQIDPDNILSLEREIVQSLEFELTPPTAFMWANFLCTRWDEFRLSHCNLLLTPEQFSLRENSSQSLKFLRRMFQLLNTMMMDTYTFQLGCLEVACSVFFLLLGVELKEFSEQQVLDGSFELICFSSDKPKFVELMNSFFYEHTQLDFSNLEKSVKFSATFFALPHLPLKSPKGGKPKPQNLYEETLTLHVHDDFAADFVLSQRERKDSF